MSRVKEAKAKRLDFLRSKDTDFQEPKKVLAPAAGERKTELTQACKELLEKRDFSHDDLLVFSSYMIQLLGGSVKIDEHSKRMKSSPFRDENGRETIFDRSTIYGVGGLEHKVVRSETMEIRVSDVHTGYIDQTMNYGIISPSTEHVGYRYWYVGFQPESPIIKSNVRSVGQGSLDSIMFHSYLTGNTQQLFPLHYVESSESLDELGSQNVCRKLYMLYQNIESQQASVSSSPAA